MQDWTDSGVVIAARLFSETDTVVHILTEEHGLHAGLVKGGASRKRRADFELGNHVTVTWRARLQEQLGQFILEVTETPAAHILTDRAALLALQYVCTLTKALPEREPQPQVFNALKVVTNTVGQATNWPALIIRYELGVLEAMGFGLDLSQCAGGGDDDLAYVSPRTGRAVSREKGGPYKDKLLPLPPFLLASQMAPTIQDIDDGLRLTGYFLQNRLYASVHQPLPDARAQMVMLLTDADTPPQNQ